MAPNSSSVFNEAPTEAKPPSTSTESSMAPANDARPVSSVSTSTVTVTSSSDCSAKQAAPKMEAAIDDMEERSAESGTTLRFERVVPVGLDEAKKTLVYRKSCLKRSSSFLPSSFTDMPQEVATPTAVVVDETPKEPEAPVQKNRRRCWECKAKVGLTALTCRCDYTFCSKHRYAEEHNCKFNFKSAAKRKLEDENPRVVPAKVARIN